jgi:hypothetical protein
MLCNHLDLLRGWKVPGDSPVPKLTRVAKYLLSLIAHAPEVGLLDTPALNLSLDLSLDPLLCDKALLELVKLQVQVVLEWAVQANFWDTLWDLGFGLDRIHPLTRWLSLLGWSIVTIDGVIVRILFQKLVLIWKNAVGYLDILGWFTLLFLVAILNSLNQQELILLIIQLLLKVFCLYTPGWVPEVECFQLTVIPFLGFDNVLVYHLDVSVCNCSPDKVDIALL